jgi:segregation and condensation protein B
MAKKSTKRPKNKKAAKPRTPEAATAPEPVAEAVTATDSPVPEPCEPDGPESEAAIATPSDTEGAPQTESPDARGDEAPADEASEIAAAESRVDVAEALSDGGPAEADSVDLQGDDPSAQADAAQTDGSGGETTADGAQVELPLAAPASAETAEGGAEALEADQASVEGSRLESIIESLLFASDKALGLAELKRLLGERDGKKITAAMQSLMEKRQDTGIQVVALSTGWHLRTHVNNAAWVSRLLVGRPVRLSRAMMETLAIVAYRQPVTRPEVDDIRGVDCGPVLKTLLDRGFVRIIGKKEEVGRPLLYGTTPEFLRVFNLRDLSELPTLREFYDLSAEDQSRVDAEHGEPATPPSATSPKPGVALTAVPRGALEPEPEDTDPLLDELDEAAKAAKQALGGLGADAGVDASDEAGEGPKPEQDGSPPVVE